MTKHCEICGGAIRQDDRVHVGIVTRFIEIPSQSSWAVERPEQFTFVNHLKCEELE